MATVTRPFYTVTVSTLGGGEFAIADTADIRSGKSAWDSIQRRNDICVAYESDGDPVTLFIPFHAIDHAILSVTPTEGTKADSPCPEPVEDGGEGN